MPLATSYPSPQLLGGAAPDRVHWPELPLGLPGVAAARSATAAWLRGQGLAGDGCDDAILVLSELATNALLHTGEERFMCCVGLTEDRSIHLEVHDHGTAARPTPGRPGLDDEGGRGLVLIQLVAKRWGVEQSVFTSGNAVWARVATC
ncbi:Histidine kinase-like ATPase domain-containing protein [Actinacidiphila yanglinensis]|uniref:Histidine kinase-like ATPase domain-containing protein n=1 Tax=Actinacidiphila yanglinensis TaxID=310779 RepID=A0A1H6B340_9ACTN|nr:ATP-binding protein [Actinacidiphila yanglinensis]SEG55259.1 Histidine kinase-like ATPase domain-containing protein [Actinacidiphila yanglinensis]